MFSLRAHTRLSSHEHRASADRPAASCVPVRADISAATRRRNRDPGMCHNTGQTHHISRVGAHAKCTRRGGRESSSWLAGAAWSCCVCAHVPHEQACRPARTSMSSHFPHGPTSRTDTGCQHTDSWQNQRVRSSRIAATLRRPGGHGCDSHAKCLARRPAELSSARGLSRASAVTPPRPTIHPSLFMFVRHEPCGVARRSPHAPQGSSRSEP
mmetsp:Transcript_35326/g.97785  ORF Transcript_35326/g.97785 Transcript_35326/m.97785 type:complete len:212 (-) Transcript_35326:1454-2089(-)